MARPTFKPTDEQRDLVRDCARVGTPEDEIRLRILKGNGRPISRNSLRKHFKNELEVERIKATVDVAKSLYQKAIDGNVSAQIFWLKTQAGWREQKPEDDAISSNDDAPYQNPNPGI